MKKAKGAPSDGAVPGFKRFTDDYTARDANCNVVSDNTLAAMESAIMAEIRRDNTPDEADMAVYLPEHGMTVYMPA